MTRKEKQEIKEDLEKMINKLKVIIRGLEVASY